MAGASLVEQRVGLLVADLSLLRCVASGPLVVELRPVHLDHAPAGHEVDPSVAELEDAEALALAATPPGTALLGHLERLADSLSASVSEPEPVEVSDAVLVEAMAAAGRQAAQAAALQLRFGAELEHRRRADAEAAAARAPRARPWDGDVRVFTAEEVAARLHTSVAEAQALVARAGALSRPGGAGTGVLAALEVGAIDLPRAAQLLDALAPLPEATADAVTARVLPGAGRITRRSLARRTAAAVIGVDPAAAAERARTRRSERGVRWWAEDDGQACLQLRGVPRTPSPRCGARWTLGRALSGTRHGMFERAAAAAEGRPVDRAAAGTLDELRFDAAVAVARDVLEGACGPVERTAASRPVVHVTVPASVLLGLDERTAWLHGYGPLDAEAARAIAADATWRRVLTDPATGVAVHVSEDAYQPSVGLQRLVATRHRTCTVPGCGPGVALRAGPPHGLARRTHLRHQPAPAVQAAPPDEARAAGAGAPRVEHPRRAPTDRRGPGPRRLSGLDDAHRPRAPRGPRGARRAGPSGRPVGDLIDLRRAGARPAGS